jgi:hypothetical protein
LSDAHTVDHLGVTGNLTNRRERIECKCMSESLFSLSYRNDAFALTIPRNIGNLSGNGTNLVFENVFLINGIPNTNITMCIYVWVLCLV